MTEYQYAIEVKNVSKKFRVYFEKNMTLKEKIIYFGRARYKDFTALENVTLNIRKGTTVGLIGANGSGKSTMLKLISKIIYPDSGTISVNGRVSSLLELGAGFHPDFTGRENIFMNGSILGLSRKEINKKLDEIINFSELIEFIDQPVRSYSSGMYMRLAFSVAVAVDPEILLIDEILAVGDAAFQAKCMTRIKQLQSQDKTIVIVSHDLSAIERYCDEAVWIDNSNIRMIDKPVNCIQAYTNKIFKVDDISQNANILSDENNHESKEYEQNTVNLTNRWGNKNVFLKKILVNGIRDSITVKCEEKLLIELHYRVNHTVNDVVFGIGIFDAGDKEIYGSNTSIERIRIKSLDDDTDGIALIEIKSFNLLPGEYFLDLAIHTEEGVPFDYWRKAFRVSVISDIKEAGIVRLAHDWKI